ncbi:MAG: hypothetical protein AAF384_06710 [Pseudomonadota bacterium]
MTCLSRHAPILMLALLISASASANYQLFEAGQVRPLAISPDGLTLAATNTPDDRIEIFSIQGDGSLLQTGSVPVGMRPVALAFRSNSELWVVNHLSDSVSIVTLGVLPHVSRTLLVGDEPRSVVFAGTGGNRAFVTTAHRGQHRLDPSIAAVQGAGDPLFKTPGVARADVWVFDASALGTTIGGTPIEILSFFADTPRDLAVSPDGNTVYVGAFHSGNETTVVPEWLVCNDFQVSGGSFCPAQSPGGLPGPSTNCWQNDLDPACEEAVQADETGLIVRFDGSAWMDTIGRDWSALIPYTLPDYDVFSIDANTLAPGSVVEFPHVGTILFNLAVNPVSGRLYVSNTESPNEVLFEGAGVFGGSTVQGHLAESRITVIDPVTTAVDPQHLNQHIDYSQLHTDPGADHAAIDAQAAHSLAAPTDIVVSSDGSTIYLAAFSSAKVGVFTSAAIEDPSFETNFDPTTESTNYIDVGGGPSGLALNESANRLYVLTRFSNQIEVVDLLSSSIVGTHPLHNPEPPSIVDGRPFLYDAQISSANGETSCASCHIFGDMDSLAWNLGDPDGRVTTNQQPTSTGFPAPATFHPMKGPMATQTFRGMATHGAMHWRGDRSDGIFGLDPCTEPTGAPCNEDLSFRNFLVAFEGLLGKFGTITALEMQKFTDYVLQLQHPPNPVRQLDNSLNAQEQAGSNVFFNVMGDALASCNGCHELDASLGFFGTNGTQSFEGEPFTMKVPHMRNMFAKVGMFKVAGDQIRGFGFTHDGSLATMEEFFATPVFTLNQTQREDVEVFSFSFPSDLAPVVGQQVTLTATNSVVANPRIDLLIQRAGATFNSLTLGGAVAECDLIVKGLELGAAHGWLRLADGTFQRDDGVITTDLALRGLASTEGPLTYTCVPPGSGNRTAIDRDQDTLLDGVETNTGIFLGASDTGTNPALSDTDGDGFSDADEVNNLPNPTNPNNPADFPGAIPPPTTDVPALPVYGAFLLLLILGTLGFVTLPGSRQQ